MPQFSSGENREGIRSAKWVPSSYGFEGHVVRTAIGTSEAAEYCHAAADVPWGILANEGTQNNFVNVATEGVINMRNSLNGTVALGDPVILDYTNSGGTTGFVRSAYNSLAMVNAGNISLNTNTGTALLPYSTLPSKAVPGSLRDTGNNAGGVLMLGIDGLTVVSLNGAMAIGNYFYQIDQPVLGFAKEVATTPRQLFKVEIVKERFIKNNSVN